LIEEQEDLGIAPIFWKDESPKENAMIPKLPVA
jgi:hypothetical protein